MSATNGVKNGENDDHPVEIQINVMRDVNSGILLMPKKKNKVTKNYKQYYRKAWEEVPEFKEWLAEIPGERYLAYCKICQKTLYAHRLSLIKHTVSLKHCRLAQKRANEQHDNYYLYEDPDEPLEQSCEVEGEVSSQQIVVDTVSEEGNGMSHEKTVVAEEIILEPCGETEVVTEVQKPDAEVNATNGDELPSLQEQTSTPQPAHSPPTPHSSNTAQIITVPAKTVSIAALSQLSPHNQTLIQLRKSLTNMPAITTHVLDTSRGSPAAGLAVSLYQLVDGKWTLIKDGHTNGDGRCSTLFPPGYVKPGRYKLHFDTDRYFLLHKQPTFFPFVELVFDITSPEDRNHIPLLLSPYGYTVYKGS